MPTIYIEKRPGNTDKIPVRLIGDMTNDEGAQNGIGYHQDFERGTTYAGVPQQVIDLLRNSGEIVHVTVEENPQTQEPTQEAPQEESK